MDGLEAVELRLSDVLENNEKLRLDPEYFKKEYLEKISSLKEFGYKTINELAFVTDGIHESIEFDVQSTINLISAKSPKENIFDLSSNDFISIEQHEKNPRTELKENDVIISTVGTIGNCAVVDKTILPANSDRHVGIVRLNDNFKPHALSTFLLSKYGRFQTLRESTGNVQLNLFIYKIKTLKIPTLSSDFQSKIDQLVQLAHKKIEQSKADYQQAENLLLTELNLLDFKPSTENISIKSFGESFGISGRLDSEYYQPKYDEVKNISTKKADYVLTIKDIKNYNARGVQPTYIENGTLDIINSRHILNDTLDYENFQKTDYSYWDKQEKAQVFKGDILTYTTGANIGRTSVYLIDKPALASNHVNILRIENENPVYVSFVLNSIVGRLQTEKLSAGSAQQELYPKDINSFYIPFVKKQTQTQIEQKIKASFKLKAESKQLLDLAKLAVEMAIEQNEAVALDYINTQTKELNHA